VKLAGKLAKPGSVVLLSPAAASFGEFKDYVDRGDQFCQSVKSLL
jgi:UDP-N-acetylmuramoylalanine--D-glutamate ligase